MNFALLKKLPDEKIIKIIHRDGFILFKKMVLFVLMVGLFFVFNFLLQINFPDLYESEIVYPLAVIGASVYFLFIWLFLYFSFVDYYLDIWIITNERVVDVSHFGFFSRKVAELNLDNIQDVTSEVSGFWPTIMKYGNVYVQTAAEKERFSFQEVPNPEEIRDLIMKTADEHKAHVI